MPEGAPPAGWVSAQRQVDESWRQPSLPLTSAPLTAASPPKPTMGLCQSWALNADVQQHRDADTAVDYTQDAINASEVLYELSGRRFRGSCAATDRPGSPLPRGDWSRFRWGYDASLSAWGWWPGDAYGVMDLRDWFPIICSWSDTVVLANVPVIAVTGVTISGDTVSPSAFRIEDGHYLRRIDGGTWPAYQDLSTDTGSATFTISYTHGEAPPKSGVEAACALALALNRAKQGQEITLPLGVLQIVRNGVTLSRAALAELQQSGFGIPLVDIFLAAWRIDAPAASVWSPDIPYESPLLGGTT